MSIAGAGFTEATAVRFLFNDMADGTINVTALTVNSDGTVATATIAIAATAIPGDRVVQIVTPGRSSTSAGTRGNLFHVQ
jgi:hypothetical protein